MGKQESLDRSLLWKLSHGDLQRSRKPKPCRAEPFFVGSLWKPLGVWLQEKRGWRKIWKAEVSPLQMDGRPQHLCLTCLCLAPQLQP